MEEAIHFGALTVQTIFTDREVNFWVKHGPDYFFRLVPGYQGFELSTLDTALNAAIDQTLVDHIGEQIDLYYS